MNLSKTKIISCDVFSHEKLLQQKIDHDVIENYILDDDQKLIDELIIKKSHEWYDQDGISEFLKFENMNLGSLLELEIAPYFLEIIKNFIGIKRVMEKENPSEIKSSTLISLIVKSFIKDKEIKLNSYNSLKGSALTFDRVAIPIKFGNKFFTIWISRNFAIKIKNLVEFVTNLIFKFNFSNISKRKSIILLDFNPMVCGDFLKNLSQLNRNIVLLNQRRPAVWNLESLKNVKKSNSKIIKLETFLNSKYSFIIKQKQKELQQNLQKMFLNDTALIEFFSIDKISFWPCIKDNFIEMCSERFNEIIKKFILSKELIKKLNPSCMIFLYDSPPEEKTFINAADEFNIPGIILQHGLLTKRDTGTLTSLLPFIPPNGIKHGLWGSESEKMWHEMGVNNKDILLIGNPRYDELFKMRDKCKNKNIILLGTSILPELAYSSIDTNMLIKFKNILKGICKTSVNIPNKQLIIKLHPGQHSSYDIQPTIKEIDPSISIYKNNNVVELLKDCEVFIYIGYSTVLLEAMILNKPTITFKIGPDWDYDDEIFKSGSTILVTNMVEFENALKKILFDEIFRNQLLERSKRYIEKCFVNQGNSSQYLKNILKDY
jgi:glycosyltransferase involved in cell wall biosynthesis